MREQVEGWAARSRRRAHRRVRSSSPATRRAAALLAASLVIALGIAGSALQHPAQAEAVPGVPEAPTLVYSEDFQNRPGPAPIVRLNAYTGVTGETYTAAPGWLTGCNGWIASANQTLNGAAQITDCNVNGANGQVYWNATQQLSQALGVFRGQSVTAARDNYSVSAFTANNPGAGAVEFQTVTNVPFVGANRFINFSVDVAAVNCQVGAPLLQFSLLTDTGAAVPVGSQINACASLTTVAVPALGQAAAATARVGTYTSNGAVLVNGTSIGVRMVNNYGSGGGNDHAFDNISIIDVTPALDKSFAPSRLLTGETSVLTFTVTNTSELAAKNGWSFTDSLPTGLVVAAGAPATTCPSGVVTAPLGGAQIAVAGDLANRMTSCTISVKVTSDTAGTYVNGPANVAGVGVDGPDPATVTFATPVSLSIQKTATSSPYVPGQPLGYTVTVSNGGPGTAVGATVTDPLPAELAGAGFAWACAPSPGSTCTATGAGDLADTVTIPAGGTVTYAVTGTVPIDATGDLTNVATVTPPADADDPACTPDCTTAVTSVAPAPAITLEKSAGDTAATTFVVGGDVTYSFVVTNTGNVPLASIAVVEGAFSGTGVPTAPSCPTSPLGPGEQVLCTSTYTLTQADIDAGSLSNTATATAQPPYGGPIESAPSTVLLPADQAPAVSLVKTATPAVASATGEPIEFAFTIENIGNTTLTSASVAELAFDGTGPLTAPTCPTGGFVPGEQVVCTAEYEVTQADMDRGSITNTATASASSPLATAVSESSTVVVDLVQSPSLTLAKSADVERVDAVGDVVSYAFLVTNTGTVTVTDVAVLDVPTPPAGALATGPDCPETVLAPGEGTTCTGTYVVSQADLDAGAIEDTATASAIAPDRSTVTSPTSTVTVDVAQAPQLTLAKSANVASVSAVGDVIGYEFLVTNTGTVTVNDVGVLDVLAPPASGLVTGPDCPEAVLAPGEDTTCTGTYVVTQADLDAGAVGDTATARGLVGSGTVVESAPSTVTVDVAQAPAITITKTADVASVAAVGDEIEYEFQVSNTGTVTLTQLAIDDVAAAPAGELTTGPECPVATLAPGAETTCTGTYLVTQADLDAGSIEDTATAAALAPDASIVRSAPSTALVAAVQSPALTLVKTADVTSVSAEGDAIAYAFVVANTGTVTLTEVVVDDVPAAPAGELTTGPDCPATTLAPGEETTCTGTYLVTRADLDAGSIGDTATASASAPDGTPAVSAPSSAVVDVELPVVPPGSGSPGQGSPASPPSAVASTGYDIAPPILGATALILAGMAVAAATRRRRRS